MSLYSEPGKKPSLPKADQPPKRRLFRRPQFDPTILIVGSALVATLAILGGLVWGGVFAAKKHNTEHGVTATICSKQVIPGSNNSGPSYEVFTDVKIFKVAGHVANGVSLNPEQLYGQLREGTTYDFTYDGFDKESVGIYPNILTATQSAVQQPNACKQQLLPTAAAPTS